MQAHEVDELLSELAPYANQHTDEILNLRDTLLSGGHPGKCVRCFFTICQSAGFNSKTGISTFASWLERNIELTVSSGSRLLETLPLNISQGEDLESYCRNMIRGIRMDRSYAQNCITIRFRYRDAA